MLGYRLVRFESRPAEAWREMKNSANHLAESICQMITRLARDAEQVSGQRIQSVEIRKGNFRISTLRDWAYTPSWKANWGRVQVYHYHEPWCLSLPEKSYSHWPVKASVARVILETLASVSENDIQGAIDEALENNNQ